MIVLETKYAGQIVVYVHEDIFRNLSPALAGSWCQRINPDSPFQVEINVHTPLIPTIEPGGHFEVKI